MNVTQLKQALLLCREAEITPFLWGRHGIGKSSALKQLCELMGIGLIDMRCSQLEASDLRGLPDREMIVDPESGEERPGRTTYLPPADLPLEAKCSPACSLFLENGGQKNPVCIKREEKGEMGCQGILFLDEMNRAEDDVLQAGFQLVYDYRVGTYVIPRRRTEEGKIEGWSICVAGNYMEGYTVNNFGDPAFFDRFCHLDLTAGGGENPYMEDWSAFMKAAGGAEADKIIQFVSFNETHLLPEMEIDRGFSVSASPRSWEMVAKVENASHQGFKREVVIAVLTGIIGQDLALLYDQFTAKVTPTQVINNFAGVESTVRGLTRNQLIGLVWGVAANAKTLTDKKEKGQISKETERKMNNVLDFMQSVASHQDRDMAVMLGRQLCAGETKSLGGAVLSNPHLAKMAAKFKSANKGAKTWIAMIDKRPPLQKLMSKVSFGSV
jgi:hypothetical protein